MTSNLQKPVFTDEAKAREWLEAQVWPDGPICPHCNAVSDRVTKLGGESHRAGMYQCKACRQQFTVTVGTVFERSKVPLTKWLAALFLLTSSKKGVSAHQIHRSLGVTYKTAWFMMHRLREAMRPAEYPGPMGGDDEIVEVDETFIGGKAGNRKSRNVRKKQAVVALVHRGAEVRSFTVKKVNSRHLNALLRKQVSKKSYLMTDDSNIYPRIGKKFARHSAVNHSIEEYVRGGAHVNSCENYFSILKRGLTGVYHHVSHEHLPMYLAEFDFRYNARAGLGVDDHARAERAAKGIVGKRLTYRRPVGTREEGQGGAP
jgi:transposase-like protein